MEQEQETRTRPISEVTSNRDTHKTRVERKIVRRTRKERENSVDYKYTGERTLYAAILGSEEELNNYERWETHEGNTEITRVMRYAD